MGSRSSKPAQAADHGAQKDAEALLLGVMEKVKGEMIELLRRSGDVEGLGEVYNELEEILHIWRGKKRLGLMGEESGGVLNYDICDAVEIAEDIVGFYEYKGVVVVTYDILTVTRCVSAIKMRMLSSKPAAVRSESFGEGDYDDEHVVGTEIPIKALLRDVIFGGKTAFSVLTIDGMAGVGKTTLARKLYNHEYVVAIFKRRAWVHVSGDFTHKDVLIKIIQQVAVASDGDQESGGCLSPEKMMRADNATLQHMLRRHLLGMRYLVVLDDVPEEMHMDIIFKGLPQEDKGSRLVFTCGFISRQSRATARHLMKPLSSNESWQLFMKQIFSGDEEFPKQLERKAKEMLSKCGGVPSAIKNVGMQVARMRESGREWEQLLESVDFDGILDIFEASYQKLDPETKLCFMHMACFKENATIKREKLQHILEAGVEDLKGRVQSSLIMLADKSFLEVKKMRRYNVEKSYRVNVMLHRLSIKKAEEGIGFEILSGSGSNRPSQSPRHRVIKCSRERSAYSTIQNKHLVSLFLHGGGSYLDPSPSYSKSFEKLKILHLEDFGLKILPETIGGLTELRYLGLRNNHIRALPHSLGRLKKLEVLDIAENFMVEVPDIMWEMDSLLHLYMSDIVCLEPLRIDAQWHLETLTYISVDNWTCVVGGLEMEIIGLRKLGIEELDENSDVSKLFASLVQLRRLHRLILKGFRFKSMPCLDELGILEYVTELKLDGYLVRLPCSFPPYLECLKLVNTCLDEDPMPVLGNLHRLEYLKLQNAYTGEQMEILHDEFPNLKFLSIKEFKCLRNLQVGKGALSKLRKLEIKNCPYLETLPAEMGSMRKLQELRMVMTKNIEKNIRKLSFLSKLWSIDFLT